ncbi:hypothetical protein V6N12_076448 [Hibiscus sabdariffa]|uniref:Uncharacterized protein n=1 Tax=Hibiscus sabdariffa TaxID=183260 RepID=A0ABR2D9U1_9ROSI
MHCRPSRTDTCARLSGPKGNFGVSFMSSVSVRLPAYWYPLLSTCTDLSHYDPPYQYGIPCIGTMGRCATGGPFGVKFCMKV